MRIKSGKSTFLESILDRLFGGGKSRPEKWVGHFELLDSLDSQPGCPICDVVARAVESYLDGYLYESVTDSGFRKALRRSRGFCSDHAWRAMQVRTASLGMAITYEDVVSTIITTLQQEKTRERQVSTSPFGLPWKRGETLSQVAGTLADRLKAQSPCPACRYAASMDQIYVTRALELLEMEGQPADNPLPGKLCFSHFLRALRRVKTQAQLDALVDGHLAQLQSLDHELAEFIRKNDYRFRDEGFGSEGNSWQRAPMYVAGLPGFLGPTRAADVLAEPQPDETFDGAHE